ncbi:hypothetical protein TNCV_48711 [Trichonephila clavipes]|nr:hypothetical protein TNCV_48711 [Trichonephila clavipes]
MKVKAYCAHLSIRDHWALRALEGPDSQDPLVCATGGWFSTNAENSVPILLKPRKTFLTHDVHLQWILSHVNINDNEVADKLDKEDSEKETATGSSLSYQELYSNERSKLNLIRPPPMHQWYTGTSSDSLLEINVIVDPRLLWLD